LEARQLRYFVTVAEELNFTRAAERLHMVQQSLSEAIAQLETAVGFRLFERTTRRVALTPAGRAWLPAACEGLDAVDRAVDAAYDLATGRAGRLRVGLAATGALDLTPRLLRAFRARYPGVEVGLSHFDFREPTGGLRTGATDVAVVRPPFHTDGLEVVVVAEEPRLVVLAGDHPLAGRAAVDFGELVDEPWMDIDTDPLWCAFWQVAEQRSAPVRLGARCRTLDDLFEAARAGIAVGLVPESTAQSQAWPSLAFVPVRDIAPSLVAVAWHADEADPVVGNFVDLATEIAAGAVDAPQVAPL
jgi:DNA-binding transcriptional LysR family regulator